MEKASTQLNFFLTMAKAQASLYRAFDGHLGTHYGIGLTDFMILYHLGQSEGQKMRRIDLAEKVGLTASGITRLLPSMEKIGLVSKESNAQDARVSYVALDSGGRRVLNDAMETAEMMSAEYLKDQKVKSVEDMIELLKGLK